MSRQMDGLMKTDGRMDLLYITFLLSICAERQMSPPPPTQPTQVTLDEVCTYYIY